MKRFTEILSGSAAMLFQVALAGWMFCLSEINLDFNVMSLNYLWLSTALLLAYFINRLLLRRGLPVPVFVALQIVFIAAGAVLFTKSIYIEPYYTRTLVFNCIFYCIGYIVAAFIAWSPTNETGLLLRFDGLAVMLIIVLVLDELLFMPAADGSALMCAVALAVTLLAAISMKAGSLRGRGSAVQGNPALGRIMMAVVFIVMALLAALVVLYATSGMKSFTEFALEVINTCAEAVKAALLWIYRQIEGFMLWLSQFFDPGEMEAIGAEQQGGLAPPDAAEEEVGPVPSWLYYVLAGLGAALLGYIVFRLRHVRVGKLHIRRAVVLTELRRESGLKKALAELWAKLISALRFKWNCLSRRRTAPGLLVWCERKVDASLRRKADESGESFLRRAGQSYGDELGKALDELALLVERSFYSPRPAAVPAELYKTIKRGKFKIEKPDSVQA